MLFLEQRFGGVLLARTRGLRDLNRILPRSRSYARTICVKKKQIRSGAAPNVRALQTMRAQQRHRAVCDTNARKDRTGGRFFSDQSQVRIRASMRVFTRERVIFVYCYSVSTCI